MKILNALLIGILGVMIVVGCVPKKANRTPIKNVQMADLQKYIDEGALFIDVREYKETPKFKLPNLVQIPTSELKERLEEIPQEGDVIVFCRSGRRSAATVRFLNSEQGHKNLLNIIGGATAISKVYPEYLQ